MPGSFPDPQSYANSALKALEEAYEDSYDSHTGSLILTAMDAIKRLKQEIKNIGKAEDLAAYDPYELNEHNSAL
jgi:hypothetical protein